MDERTFTRQVAHRLLCDERRAGGIIFSVLQELRDRLTPGEAADVAAQLPHGLKGMWQQGERENRKVSRVHREEFVGRVRVRAGLLDDVEAERGVKAVFVELQRLLGSATGKEGEAWDVLSQLPKDLKLLWLEAAEGEPRS